MDQSFHVSPSLLGGSINYNIQFHPSETSGGRLIMENYFLLNGMPKLVMLKKHKTTKARKEMKLICIF